jgi:transposase
MPKSKPPYPVEFRSQIVELARVGRTPAELSKQFKVSEQSIRAWIRQSAVDAGTRSDGLTTDEREELRKLRREVKQLRVEREILSKAAAWFARETGKVPTDSSSS